MNEQELRMLVRRIVSERMSAGVESPLHSVDDGWVPLLAVRNHPSHTMFRVPAGADIGGPCLIEPTVACSGCGYCKSLGH